MFTITRDQLDEITTELDGLIEDYDIRTDYIGRGSRTPCIGIVSHDDADATLFLVALLTQLGMDRTAVLEQMYDLTRSQAKDSMGRQGITYWTDLTMDEDEDTPR